MSASKPASLVRRLLGRPLNVAALAWLVLVALAGVFRAQLAPYDPLDQDLLGLKQGPNADHWLGADALGRDILSRILWGAPSTLIGVAEALAVVAALGIGLGVTAGFFRGVWDGFVRLFVDVTQSLPVIVILPGVPTSPGP